MSFTIDIDGSGPSEFGVSGEAGELSGPAGIGEGGEAGDVSGTPSEAIDPTDPTDDGGGTAPSAGDTEEESTSVVESSYWSYVVPYYEVELDNEKENIVNLEAIYSTIWYTFFTDPTQAFDENPSTEVITTLSTDNAFVSYRIVNGKTRNKGSFPMQIVGHQFQELTTRYINSKYMAFMSYGDVGFPVFPNYVVESGELDYANYDSFLDVEYNENEIDLIKDNWQKESFINESGLSTDYQDSYDNFINQLATEAYNSSNKGEPRFLFQKTNEKVINLSNTSAFDVLSYTVSTATAAQAAGSSVTVYSTYESATSAAELIQNYTNPVAVGDSEDNIY